VAVVSRTAADIEKLLSEMGGTSAGHFGHAMDLTMKSAPAELMRLLKDASLDPIDIVVHNLGGTLDIMDPLCSLEDWQKVWRMNIEVAIELNLLLVPPMQKRKWGRVVHIASTASLENNGPITYCTAKAALAAYSRSFGRVLAPDGIVMTAVLPGAIATEGGYWERVMKERPEHAAKYIAERCPLGRFGVSEDIGGIVAFLCSEQAGFFQGSVVQVDGGQIRGFFS
jgi:3-oxoacyl-[acyl-carrier protein] reductase